LGLGLGLARQLAEASRQSRRQPRSAPQRRPCGEVLWLVGLVGLLVQRGQGLGGCHAALHRLPGARIRCGHSWLGLGLGLGLGVRVRVRVRLRLS
jgi:hypothetical protein